jgi:hypothetical protein
MYSEKRRKFTLHQILEQNQNKMDRRAGHTRDTGELHTEL